MNAAPPHPQRWAALSGLAFVVLFGVANALWALDTPGLGSLPVAEASSAEILGFYREASARIVAGAILSLLAIAVFVMFASALRRVLIEAEGGDVLATTAFGGAILAMAAGLGAETMNMVGAVRAGKATLSKELGQSVFEISQVLGYNAAGVGLGLFFLATATVTLRTGLVLPRWLGLVTGAVGLSLLTPLSRITLGLGLVVLLAMAVVLLRRPT